MEEQTRDKVNALSRGFLIVHQTHPELGLAFCKGFLLALKEKKAA
jgi:hypothetical protein